MPFPISCILLTVFFRCLWSHNLLSLILARVLGVRAGAMPIFWVTLCILWLICSDFSLINCVCASMLLMILCFFIWSFYAFLIWPPNSNVWRVSILMLLQTAFRFFCMNYWLSSRISATLISFSSWSLSTSSFLTLVVF